MPPRLLRRCLLFALLGLVTSVAVAWGLAVTSQLHPPRSRAIERGEAIDGDIVVHVLRNRMWGVHAECWQFIDWSNTGLLIDYHHVTAFKQLPIDALAEPRLTLLIYPECRVRALLPPQEPIHAEHQIDDQAERIAQRNSGGIAYAGTYIWRHTVGWPAPALRCSGRMDRIGANFDAAGEPMSLQPVTQDGFAVKLPWIRTTRNSTTGLSEPVRLPIEPRPGLLLNTVFYGLLWFALLLIPPAIVQAHRRARGRCSKCGYSLAGQASPGCPECGAGRPSSSPAPV